MKIVYQSVELSAGGKGSPTQLRINGSKQIAVLDDLYDVTENVVIKDLGNKTYEITWEQFREFSTVTDRELFEILHLANLPDGSGDCVFTLADTVTTLTAGGAVLQIPESIRSAGVSTFHRYQLIASTLTSATGIPSPVAP